MRQLFQEAVDSAPCIVFIGEPCMLTGAPLHPAHSQHQPSSTEHVLLNENLLNKFAGEQTRSMPLPGSGSRRSGRWNAASWRRC